MAESLTYSVTTKGDVLPGFEYNAVVSSFSTAFGVSEEKAGDYIRDAKLVKKGLTREHAEQYYQQLSEIGVTVVTKEHSGNKVTDISDSLSKPAHAFGLVAEDTYETTAVAPSPAGFACPKCSLAQSRSEQCTGCGIYFSKFNAAAEQSAANVAQTNFGGQEHRHSSPRREPAASKIIVEDNSFSFNAVLYTLIAAVLGAFAWKIIAIEFGYELGVVAWGIGGAIGFASATSGARGNVAGLSCAALALLAMFAGKYMIFDEFRSEIVTSAFSEGEGEGISLMDIYDGVSIDAEAFSRISHDDHSIKQYMVEYEYTEVETVHQISDEELVEFRTDVQPWLEDSYRASLNGGQNDQESIAEFEKALIGSTSSLVFSSLGLLDILFAFFGISTAFRLGSVGRSS